MSGLVASLKGTLLARWITTEPQPSVELLIEVHGVGYRVRTTSDVSADLGPIDSEVFIYVYHLVRAESEDLYGFLSYDARRTFELLLNAHRVGPALALAILDVHSPEVLRQVVAVDDVEALCKVPGVGPKTAVRLLVELKSKLELPEAAAPPSVSAWESEKQDSVQADVRSALAGLGYNSEEVNNVISELPETGDIEEIMREALRLVSGD